ncbi:MAG TPA: SRPBCC family protein [Mycobacteriales bacterium]|nr:SRPBCC family protein [Mycobacteriales bacterium]
MIRNSIVVNKPIDVVFRYAAQFDRHPEWQDDLKAATMEGPAAVGVKGRETRQMGRRTSSYDWQVSAFEPPHKLGFETLTGPMRPVGTMTFTSEGDATRVDFEMDMGPRGLLKLMAPMIAKQVQKSNDEHMAKFKANLESGKA